MKKILPIILGLALPVLSLAAAAPYTEFHPDNILSLDAAATDTPSEIFLPLNEYLAGFDMWLSNGGTPGQTTFTLYNQNGQQLAIREADLPAIPDTEGGTRFHVNLPAQIAVTGNKAYRIEVRSSLPQLRLYYASQIRILPLNGQAQPAYTYGLARLGAEDQAYSFAFALYENKESSPPILSNVQTGQTAIDTVQLAFNSNEPVDSSVTYNQSSVGWSGAYSSCVPGIKLCTVDLPVRPGTAYSYTLTVRDSWGNESAQSGTFTSQDYGEPAPSPTVSTPAPSPSPGISPTPTGTPRPLKITNPRVLNIKDKSADFAWTTDAAANSLVVAQLMPLLISGGGNGDPTLELEHYITVSGLIPDTYYQATITSNDQNGTQTSTTLQFLTARTTPTPTPAPQGSTTPATSPVPTVPAQTPTPVISAGPQLTWTAPPSEPKDGYRVDVFDSNNNLVRSVTVPAGTHSADISLADGQRAVVYSNNDGVYQKVAAPVSAPVASSRTKKVSLLEAIVTLLPYILGGFVLALGAVILVLKLRKKPAAAAPLT